MFGRFCPSLFFLVGASPAEAGHIEVPANAAEHIMREKSVSFIYLQFTYKIIGKTPLVLSKMRKRISKMLNCSKWVFAGEMLIRRLDIVDKLKIIQQNINIV